jgi:hypothetical protein
MAIQLADRHAPAFYGLQEDAATIAKDAGDAAGGIGVARLGQDGFNRFGRGVYSPAGIKEANEHGAGLQFFWGINDRNSRRRFGSFRNTPRMTELIILLSMSLTPRQAMQ